MHTVQHIDVVIYSYIMLYACQHYCQNVHSTLGINQFLQLQENPDLAVLPHDRHLARVSGFPWPRGVILRESCATTEMDLYKVIYNQICMHILYGLQTVHINNINYQFLPRTSLLLEILHMDM